MKKLPPGIWYEKKKRRYRVRLYWRGITIYRKYTRTLVDALAAYKDAKETQKAYTNPRAPAKAYKTVTKIISSLTHNN